MFFIEYTDSRNANTDDAQWQRAPGSFDTYTRADNEVGWLEQDDSTYVYRIVEDPLTYEPIPLDMPCGRCGRALQLAEGARDHLVECPVCDAEPGEGATPADALKSYLDKHPAPIYLPKEIVHYVVPRHPWVITVDGYPFNSLSEAETYSTQHGGAPIYCGLAKSQKAANQ